MVDFKALLSKKVVETEKPKPLPAGTYTCAVMKHEGGESQQKKTPFIRFILRVMATGADVPVEALPPDWQGRELRGEFYLTDASLWRLREFIENALGLEIGMKSYDEILPDTLNKMVGVQLTQVPSQKPGDASIYNQIQGYVKI